jgi:hypothetical protein
MKHLEQGILHVRTKLLISQCKCLPQPHIITWPSKKEEDVFHEATRTYGRALYLLKQVKSKPAEYNGNFKEEVSVLWLPFLLQILDVWGSNLSIDTTHPDKFYGLCQFFQLNSRIIPQISPLSLPSISFSIHYSLILTSWQYII